MTPSLSAKLRKNNKNSDEDDCRHRAKTVCHRGKNKNIVRIERGNVKHGAPGAHTMERSATTFVPSFNKWGVYAVSAFSKFYFRPGENERVETTVRLKPDSRSAIHGLVKDPSGHPLESALVMLFEVPERGRQTLVGQLFTDDEGQFVFGPLAPDVLHMIKVYKNSVKLRELEIVTDAERAAPGTDNA